MTAWSSSTSPTPSSTTARALRVYGRAGGARAKPSTRAAGAGSSSASARPRATPARWCCTAWACATTRSRWRRDGTLRPAPTSLFGWAWELCYNTIQANVEDCILADSWRERAVYASDILAQAPAFMSYSRDLALAKRTSRLYTEARRANGLLCALHPDGAGTATSSCEPALAGALPPDLDPRRRSRRRRQNLADHRADPHPPTWPAPSRACGFYLLVNLRLGRHPAMATPATAWAMRCSTCGATAACATAPTPACALGRGPMRLPATRPGRLPGARIHPRRRCWDHAGPPPVRPFVDGKPDPKGAAMHANALALAYGVASPEQVPGCAAALERALADNVERNERRHLDHSKGEGEHQGTLEIFFLHFAMVGLYRHGYAAVAERALRDHHPPMFRMRGLPGARREDLCRRASAWQANLCQSWGATFAICAHEYILGVRPEVAGDPLRMLVAPDCTLEWAEGAVPHPRGPAVVCPGGGVGCRSRAARMRRFPDGRAACGSAPGKALLSRARGGGHGRGRGHGVPSIRLPQPRRARAGARLRLTAWDRPCRRAPTNTSMVAPRPAHVDHGGIRPGRLVDGVLRLIDRRRRFSRCAGSV